MSSLTKPYEYILYIDEAGDDGLKRVKPLDLNGSSEWLFIGGLLIREEYEKELVSWIKEIRTDINATQSPALHYRKLSPTKRQRACEMLAEKPCRFFIVASNKKNMKDYRNEKAARRGSKQWYYNYCVRLLMERATDFCAKDSIRRYGSHKSLKVVFSQRGGHSYGQTKAYWEILKAQAANKSTYLNRREIRHEVLRYDLVDYVPHFQEAGLQLADVVTSAFYQAGDELETKLDIKPAQLLKPRVAIERGVVADYGLILQPEPKKAKLTTGQREIFEFYGYQF